ncbi:MAG TPA: hypothetical protein VHO03_08025 [Ignavibacteriales bacterium]|nr:hypothetical protein [Ignavibacteriales bacterium]
MNFFTKNENILAKMEEIFGKSSNSNLVNFSGDYSQGRKLTSVSVQIEGFPLYHSLIFIYNRSVQLYDVLKYKNHTVYRMGQLTQVTPQIEAINNFILKNIPHVNPQNSRKLNEDSEINDSQIEILKSENKMLKGKIQSLRSQMDSLRDKISMLNNKIKWLRNSKSDDNF